MVDSAFLADAELEVAECPRNLLAEAGLGCTTNEAADRVPAADRPDAAAGWFLLYGEQMRVAKEVQEMFTRPAGLDVLIEYSKKTMSYLLLVQR